MVKRLCSYFISATSDSEKEKAGTGAEDDVPDDDEEKQDKH
jgi:hypothetical protein